MLDKEALKSHPRFRILENPTSRFKVEDPIAMKPEVRDKLDKKSTSPVVHKEVNKKSGKSFWKVDIIKILSHLKSWTTERYQLCPGTAPNLTSSATWAIMTPPIEEIDEDVPKTMIIEDRACTKKYFTSAWLLRLSLVTNKVNKNTIALTSIINQMFSTLVLEIPTRIDKKSAP